MPSGIKTNSAQWNTVKPSGLQSYIIKDFYRDPKSTRLISTASHINSQCRQGKSKHKVSTCQAMNPANKDTSVSYLFSKMLLAAYYCERSLFAPSPSIHHGTHLFHSRASLGTKLVKNTITN